MHQGISSKINEIYVLDLFKDIHQRIVTVFTIGNTSTYSYTSAISSLPFLLHAGQMLRTSMVSWYWVHSSQSGKMVRSNVLRYLKINFLVDELQISWFALQNIMALMDGWSILKIQYRLALKIAKASDVLNTNHLPYANLPHRNQTRYFSVLPYWRSKHRLRFKNMYRYPELHWEKDQWADEGPSEAVQYAGNSSVIVLKMTIHDNFFS